MSSEIKITLGVRNWASNIDAQAVRTVDVGSISDERSTYRPGIIYKLDETTRAKFRESDHYTPRIVSFGPHYNGHPSYTKTQQKKEAVLINFVKRSNKKLVDIIEVLKQDFASLKDRYKELDQRWQQDDDAFAMLMILDGCFFLEAAREICESLEADRSNRHYEYDNPLWDIDGLRNAELREKYIHDMLLLENQIPIQVLGKICETGFGRDVGLGVCRLPSPLLPREVDVGVFRSLDIVSWYWVAHVAYTLPRVSLWARLKSQIPYFSNNSGKTTLTTELRLNIPSAMELEKVGIRFTTTESMTKFEFSFSGRTVSLPQISVDGTTKSIFANLIAYEELYGPSKEVTSYVYFISRLLRNEDDVKLLELHNIIHSALSCKDIIDVFDNVTTQSFMRNPDDFLMAKYKTMCGNLRERYNNMSKGWQRDLWQNYLKSPFGIVSIIVAFFVFAFTIIQTVYTVLSYYV